MEMKLRKTEKENNEKVVADRTQTNSANYHKHLTDIWIF